MPDRTRPVIASVPPSCRSLLLLAAIATLLGPSPLATRAGADCADYESSIRWVYGESFWHYTPGWNSPGTVGCARSGATLFTIDDLAALESWEITAPGTVAFRGSLFLDQLEPVGIDVTPTRAYLTVNSIGLVIVNTTDPTHLQEVARLGLSGVGPLDVDGNLACVATTGGLIVARVTEPIPSVRGQLAGWFSDVVLSGNRAYVVGPAGLQVVNVSTPSLPAVIATPSSTPFQHLVRQGGFLYATGPSAGMQVFDLTDPDAPVPGVSVAIAEANALALGEGMVLVRSARGVTCVDLHDPATPAVRGTYASLDLRGGTIGDGFAYLASGYYGLQVMHLGSGTTPPPVFTLPSGAGGADLSVNGTVLTMLGGGALRTFDVADPAQPSELGSVAVTFGRCLAGAGERAYVLQGSNFEVVDLADPSQPVVVGALPSVNADLLAVNGDRVYAVSSTSAAVWVIDASAPANPVLLAQAAVGGNGWITSAVALGPVLYLSSNFEGSGWIDAYDFSAPAQPQWLNQGYVYDAVTDLRLAAGKLFILMDRSIGVTDPATLAYPQSVGSHSFGGRLAAGADGRIYSADTRGAYRVCSYDGSLHYQGSGSTPNWGGTRAGVAEVAGYVYVTDASGLQVFAPACASTSVPEVPAGGEAVELTCLPNPCRDGAALSFRLERPSVVALSVFDASGRLVRTLLEGRPVGAGEHELRWDGRDARGYPVARGVYFARMSTGGRSFSRKVDVVR